MNQDRIYILSDLHINLLPPQKSAAFLEFITRVVADNATALYLNGDIVDLMEAGVPDHSGEVIPHFFTLLKDLAGRGVTIHYNLGNHDLPLLLLFPDFPRPDGQYIDVHAEHAPVEVMPNIFLHYRTIRFTYGSHNVYLEHSHIYDLGWVPGCEWNTRWVAGGNETWSDDFVDNVLKLRKIFEGGGEDYSIRILRTGSHLPAPLYASREARRIAAGGGVDWVIFGHFHSPVIEEIGDGKLYANPGDSLQHGNYIVLTEDQIRLADWREVMRAMGGNDGG